MSGNIASIKKRMVDAEARVAYLESLLDSFFTGDVPDNTTLEHMILAKYGRKRLEELKAQPAILRPSN